MRDTSSHLSTKDSQQLKQNQGGEKKVMKKSLSVVLAASLAMSSMSAIALAAEDTATTTSTAASTAQEKFDALRAAGIFDGLEDGTAGLDQNMTRAQFAKIIVKLKELTEDESGASVYKDLDGAGWATGYIGAVTKAKYFDGVEAGKFDPSGNVTAEQMATVLARVYNLQIDASASVTGTVSDWAKGYVASVVKAGLLSGVTDFTAPAKRETLVNSTYSAYTNPPVVIATGKVGVADLKVTGAKTLTLKLSGAIADTSKAVLSVKRDGTAVSPTVKWADDKQTATITFETSMPEATYAVTLSGLENLDADHASKEVSVEAEKATKIDFATSSETLPQSEVRVDFKVLNQYGEDMKKPASQFKIRTNLDDEDWSEIAGESAIKLQLNATDEDYDAANRKWKGDEKYDRNFRVNIYINDEDTGLSASKIFTVGDQQIVTKLEVGDLMDQAGKVVDSIDIEELGYLKVKAWDQYGVEVIDRDTLNKYVSAFADVSGIEFGDYKALGKNADDYAFDEDVDGDNYKDFAFYVTDKVKKGGEYTINLYSSGNSVSKKIVISATEKPASVEFGTTSLVLAENDGLSDDSSSALYKKYVQLILKNANGEELSKDDIVTAAEKGDIKVDVTNGSAFDINDSDYDEGVVTKGPFKGYIELNDIDDKGSATLVVSLKEKPEVKAQLRLTVGSEREVQTIKLTSNNGDKGVRIGDATAEAKFKVKFFDQYSEEAKDALYAGHYAVKVTFTGSGTESDGNAYLSGASYFSKSTNGLDLSGAALGSSSVVDSVYSYYFDLADLFDKELKINNGQEGVTYKVKYELVENKNYDEDATAAANKAGASWSKIAETTKTYEVIKGSNKTLSYTASIDKAVMDGDRVALQDLSRYQTSSGLILGVSNVNTDGVTTTLADDLSVVQTGSATTTTTSSGKVIISGYDHRKAGKEIKITAKDGSETVLLPNVITGVYSSNSTVAAGYALREADAYKTDSSGSVVTVNRGVASSDVGKAFVYGFDEGTANLTVEFKTTKGSSTASIPVVVLDKTTSIKAINPKRVIREYASATVANSYKLWDEAGFGEYKAVDEAFGNEFSKANFDAYSDILSVRYVVVESQDEYDSIVINNDGSYTITDKTSDSVSTANGGSFTIKAVAPSGAELVFELGY
ncbi:S-layer homology domain-containing protein [Paenibacillus sp. y28]|uniref:S-layer homology domain-containing protein n=1 Tax=Paenibacillus sp. y28 TaxID=3129110 RepID=UPI0030166582